MTKKPKQFTAEYISRGADARLRPEAQELAEQVFFMRGKLEEVRKELKDAPIITEYDNGGQQKGTHANPAFRAYKDLVTTYTRTLSALEEIIGSSDPEVIDGTLEELRSRFKLNTDPIKEPEKATGTDEAPGYWKKNPQKGAS